MASKLLILDLASFAAATVLAMLFRRRLSPMITSPPYVAARSKKDGPKVSVDGASPELATV